MCIRDRALGRDLGGRRGGFDAEHQPFAVNAEHAADGQQGLADISALFRHFVEQRVVEAGENVAGAGCADRIAAEGGACLLYTSAGRLRPGSICGRFTGRRR